MDGFSRNAEPLQRQPTLGAWTSRLCEGDDALDLLLLRQVGRVDEDGVAGLSRLSGIGGVTTDQSLGFFGDLWIRWVAT